MAAELPLLDAAALRAAVGSGLPECPGCGTLQCEGWESVSGPVDPPQLVCIGTLRDPVIEEPTLTERHEAGTGYWHARAPVAVLHHPYNRCGVWRCPRCGRGLCSTPRLAATTSTTASARSTPN